MSSMNLFNALRWARENLERDMAVSTLQGLMFAADHTGCTTGELWSALGVTSGTGTRVVSRLSDWEGYEIPGLGLLTSEPDARDRRIRRLYLTPKGQRVVKELIKIIS
jgi:DNA-binding MarR family transcriptional regulator